MKQIFQEAQGLPWDVGRSLVRAVWWNRQEGTAYFGVGIKVVFLPRAHRMGVQAVSSVGRASWHQEPRVFL